MLTKLTIFVASLAAMPIVAQIEPSGIAGKLAVGSTQSILAIVVVAQAVAIFKMFKLWRADIQAEREAAAEMRSHLESVISENAVSQAQVATAVRENSEAVHHFANVIDKAHPDG